MKSFRNPLVEEHERIQLLASLKGAADMLRTEGASEDTLQVILDSINKVLQITGTPSTPTADQTSTPPANNAAQDSTLQLSQVANQPLNWLWPQLIPLGKLTLLDGEAGSGTSLLALTIAAHVSSGRPLPGVPSRVSQPLRPPRATSSCLPPTTMPVTPSNSVWKQQEGIPATSFSSTPSQQRLPQP